MTVHARLLVLFDWNGTVMDDLDRAVTATNDAVAGRGIPTMDRATFQNSFTLPMKNWLRGMGIADSEVDGVEARWNTVMESPAPVRDGAADMLAALRRHGVVTGVVTAADAAVVHNDLERNGLAGVFDHVRASVADKAECLASLRPLGDDAFYIGDTAYDMTCARRAGYTPISIGGGYQDPSILAAAGSDHHLEDLADLSSLLGLLEEAPGANL